MSRYLYQSSAYGHPWQTDQEDDNLTDLLGMVSSRFWLSMLRERHHRIIDTQDGGRVVWFERSTIAPPPGSKERTA